MCINFLRTSQIPTRISELKLNKELLKYEWQWKIEIGDENILHISYAIKEVDTTTQFIFRVSIYNSGFHHVVNHNIKSKFIKNMFSVPLITLPVD